MNLGELLCLMCYTVVFRLCSSLKSTPECVTLEEGVRFDLPNAVIFGVGSLIIGALKMLAVIAYFGSPVHELCVLYLTVP